MLTTFDEQILGPIDKAFEDLPVIYQRQVGEYFSPEFKETLEFVVDAQIRTLPSGLFLMTHLYNNIHKLICLGSPSERSKAQLANSTKQAKKKYVPAQFGADEIIRRQKILSAIKKLIERIARLMGGISFLEAAPKYKKDQLETYWNQDLMLTPGSLVFHLCPPAQKDQAQDALVAFAPADCSSVEQAEQPTNTNPEMAHQDLELLNELQQLDGDGQLWNPIEKSLYRFEWIDDTPKTCHLSDLNLDESYEGESNTTGIDSGSIQSDCGLDLLESYSHPQYAESHQLTDFGGN